jgi:hypothetical protein
MIIREESLKCIKKAIERLESGHVDYFELVEQLDTLEDAVTVTLSSLEQQAFEEHKAS